MAATFSSTDLLNRCTDEDRVAHREPAPQPALRRRLYHLPPEDQQLLQVVFDGHHSLRQLARMLDVHPGTLSRRVARLIRRLNDPVFAVIADFPHDLPGRYRQIGIAHFLLGRRIAHLARELAMTTDEVKVVLAYLRGWAKARREF